MSNKTVTGSAKIVIKSSQQPHHFNTPVMANTTINDALRAEKTPSIPNFISPATYNPNRGNANSFVIGYDRTAIANGWDETLKICYFGRFLEGAASIWYKIYTDSAANRTKTWNNISEDFIKEFGDKDVKRSIEMRLLQRKQGEHESVKSYFYDLKTLFYEYDPTLNPEDFRKYFENGIRPNVYWAYTLIRKDNMDMDKFKDIVLRLDDVLEKAPANFFRTPTVAAPQTHQHTNPRFNAEQERNRSQRWFKTNFNRSYRQDREYNNEIEMKLRISENEKENLLQMLEEERIVFDKVYKEKSVQEKEVKYLLRENKDMKELIVKEEDEIKDLKAKLNNEVEDHEQLKKVNNDANSLIKSLKKSSQECEAVNIKLQAEKKYLQKVIGKKDYEISELSTEIFRLSEVIQKQTTDFNNLFGTMQEMDGIMEKIRDESCEAIKKEKESQNELKCRIEDLQKQLNLKSEKFTNLNQDLTKLEKSCIEGKNNDATKVQELESAKKKIQELKHLEEAYKNLNLEKRNLGEEVIRLKSIEQNKKSLENTLAEVRNDLKNKNSELKIKGYENNILKEEKDNLLDEIENLKTKIQELTVEISNVKVISSQVSNSNKLHQIQIEESKTEKLKQEISELTLRLQQLSTDNRNVPGEIQNHLQDTEERKIKLDSLENEKCSFVEIKLLDETKYLNSKIEEIHQQLNEAQRQNLELINVRNQLNSSEIDFYTIQKDFYEVKEKCDSLFVENKNLKFEYNKLEEKLNNLSRIKEKLDTQIIKMESHYTERLHEKQRLQDEIQKRKISLVNYPNPTCSKLEHLQILKKEQEVKLTQSERNKFTKKILYSNPLMKDYKKKKKEVLEIIQDKILRYSDTYGSHGDTIFLISNSILSVCIIFILFNHQRNLAIIPALPTVRAGTNTPIHYDMFFILICLAFILFIAYLFTRLFIGWRQSRNKLQIISCCM